MIQLRLSSTDDALLTETWEVVALVYLLCLRSRVQAA